MWLLRGIVLRLLRGFWRGGGCEDGWWRGRRRLDGGDVEKFSLSLCLFLEWEGGRECIKVWKDEKRKRKSSGEGGEEHVYYVHKTNVTHQDFSFLHEDGWHRNDNVWNSSVSTNCPSIANVPSVRKT
jgi:hypothetical protein